MKAPAEMTQSKTKRRPRKVLVIEDDAAIAEVLVFNLQREGYDVAVASDGVDGLRKAKALAPDLVVLDLMLPGLDGVEICRELRAEKSLRSLPVLMLTAKSEEADQIVGFSVGADDYVTKPFSVKVLLQRARVLLNRPKAEAGDTLVLHEIEMDRVGHQVRNAGVAIALTPTEYRLLEALMKQPGRAYSRAELLDFAVGDETIVLERTIDVHIRSLRQKLGPAADAIETVRGLGYRMAKELSLTQEP